METRDTTYGQTLGVRLLRELTAEGLIVFSSADVRRVGTQLGISSDYLRVLISQLARGGWLTRLRRGMYAVTGALAGDLHIHPFAVATQIVQPSAISHWSAMHHHGLTEQVPRGVSVITPKKVVTPSMRKPSDEDRHGHHAWEIGGIWYEYVSVKPEHFFGIAEVWIDQHFRVPITDQERTILDLFAFPRLFGGMGEALTVIEEHIQDIDLQRLVDYAVRYGTGSVAKRLGWSLERAGVAGEIIAPLAAMPTSGFRILDPTRTHNGPCDKRWGIQNNLEQERAMKESTVLL